jgi:hypothetical protein
MQAQATMLTTSRVGKQVWAGMKRRRQNVRLLVNLLPSLALASLSCTKVALPLVHSVIRNLLSLALSLTLTCRDMRSVAPPVMVYMLSLADSLLLNLLSLSLFRVLP